MLGEVLKENYELWYQFVRTKSSPNLKLRDMVFVTGCDLASDWATATVSESKSKIKLHFKVNDPLSVSTSVSLWGSWESSSPSTVPMRSGPSTLQRSENIPNGPEKNQCIFFRAFRIDDRLMVARLKASAGPHELGSGDDGSEDGSSHTLINVEFGSEEESDLGASPAIDVWNMYLALLGHSFLLVF